MNADQRVAAVAAVDAVIDAHALGDTPSAETLVDAALSALQDAIVEHATLYALALDHLDRDSAVFNAPGGLSLAMHRGDWADRGRPAKVWITVQDLQDLQGGPAAT